MEGGLLDERPCDHLRRVIEERTGRPLADIMRDLVPQLACACTKLAGEEVAATVVEQWLYEFKLASPEERWAAMKPDLKALFDKIIAEEVERRIKEQLGPQG